MRADAGGRGAEGVLPESDVGEALGGYGFGVKNAGFWCAEWGGKRRGAAKMGGKGGLEALGSGLLPGLGL